MESGDHSQRLAQYERSNRRLRLGVVFAVSLSLASLIVQFTGGADGIADVLEVRELVVRDHAGVARVRIGTELPDAIVDGQPLPRGQQIAGVLLYDDTGAERSGYVTSDNGDVGLTLDTRTEQVALLAAGADGGAWARFWTMDDADWVEMRVNELGARVNVGRDGAIVVQLPPMRPSESDAFCSDFRDEVEQLPRRSEADLVAACTRWTGEKQCRLCLGAGR